VKPASIAVLYQALPPPLIEGQRKTPKPGGYADSGADIAHALRGARHQIVTPRARPDPREPLDWVFPDTREGLASALAGGATLLWANTVLFEGHPIEAVPLQTLIVGQTPRAM